MHELKGKVEKNEIRQQARDLRLAFMLADVNPARDTVSAAVAKFRRHGYRHLLAITDAGGLICLCSDPEMSQAIVKAIQRMDVELNAGLDAAGAEKTA